jgi:hypothetical protein
MYASASMVCNSAIYTDMAVYLKTINNTLFAKNCPAMLPAILDLSAYDGVELDGFPFKIFRHDKLFFAISSMFGGHSYASEQVRKAYTPG